MKRTQLIGYGFLFLIGLILFDSVKNYLQPKSRLIAKATSIVKKEVIKVSLTTYTITTQETDDEPLITASGFTLDSVNPKKHRVIAISRDLREKFGFGDKVKLENAGKFNGIWFIRDLMHKKWKNKIDVLINPNEIQTSLSDVIIAKM